MDLCIHDCEMSGQLRASESFFSYFQVEIVGPIFLSFLKKKNIKKKKKKKISQIFRCTGCPKKKKTCPIKYMFTIYFIFTENSIKLSSRMLKNNVFKYLVIAIMYFA